MIGKLVRWWCMLWTSTDPNPRTLVEAQRDIHQRATDDLADAGLEGIHLSFYLTSIYDHSIFEVCVCVFGGGGVPMGRSNVASIAGLQQSSTETDPSAADSGELTQHSDLGK